MTSSQRARLSYLSHVLFLTNETALSLITSFTLLKPRACLNPFGFWLYETSHFTWTTVCCPLCSTMILLPSNVYYSMQTILTSMCSIRLFRNLRDWVANVFSNRWARQNSRNNRSDKLVWDKSLRSLKLYWIIQLYVRKSIISLHQHWYTVL